MVNTTPETLKARNFFICQYFSFFLDFLNFVLSLVEHEKRLYNLWPYLRFLWLGELKIRFNQIDLDVKQDKVNLGSSFVQTW